MNKDTGILLRFCLLLVGTTYLIPKYKIVPFNAVGMNRNETN